MSSDQTAKHGLGRVCQKVGHGLSCIFSDKTSLIYIFGLAAFYTWNLVDIFAPPLVGSGGGPGIEVSTVVSSVCNVGSYVAIAALLSRFRSFFALAFAAAVAAAAVVLGAWGLWSVGLVGSPEALLAYKGVTRVCAAFVIVAWGMRFSELEGSALTQRALAAFCMATLAFLVIGATRGLLQAGLFALLLPLSMGLCLRATGGRVAGEGATRPTQVAASPDCGEAPPAASGSHDGVRRFLSSVWRLLLVFTLFGIVTWVMILGAQAGLSTAFPGSVVAGAAFAVMACLLVASCVFEGIVSYRYVYKLVLPLVMVGLLLVAAFEGFRGVGAAVVSVGFTCFDLFCFVMVATACRQSGVRAGAVFGWYRALESFVPMVALGLMTALGQLGARSGNTTLYVLVAACVLVLAVVLVLDRGSILERGRLKPDVVYPRAEALYFARQCEEAISRYELSPREAEVLSLVVRGRSVPHIAERLYLSRGTVKTHIARIYRKLGVGDRQEMIDCIESLELPEDER